MSYIDKFKGATHKITPESETYKGAAYSPDFKESNLMEDELNYMPGPTPNKYVRDAQAKTPGQQQVIPDKGGWADDFSRGFPAKSPFRGKNHP